MPVSFIPSGEQTGEKQNKTARKRRRNQNVEIDELGDLLPYKAVQGKNLDKLSILRLTTSYMKLQTFMTTAYGNDGKDNQSILTNLIDQAMDGFLLVIAGDATILYASDKMESFVGLCPRDVIGHSLHDLVDSEADSETVRENLKPKGTQLHQSRMFYIRLRNAVIPGRVKLSRYSTNMMLLVSGHLKVVLDHSLNITYGKLLPELASDPEMAASVVPQKPHTLGLIVECRPIESSPSVLELNVPQMSFTSTVGMDMKIQSVDTRVREILGFDPKDFVGSGFKDYFHPRDHARMLPCKQLLQRTGYACSPVTRFMTASGEWAWIQLEGTMRFNKETREPKHLDVVIKIISQSDGTAKYIEQKEFYSKGKTEDSTPSVQHDFYDDLVPENPLPQTHESLVAGLKDANISKPAIDAYFHGRELSMRQLPELITDVVSGEEEADKLAAENMERFMKLDWEKLKKEGKADPLYIMQNIDEILGEGFEKGEKSEPPENFSPPQSVCSALSPMSSVSQPGSIPPAAVPTPLSASSFDSHIPSPQSVSVTVPSPQSIPSVAPSPYSAPPSVFSTGSVSQDSDSGIGSPTSAGSTSTPNGIGVLPNLEPVPANGIVPSPQPSYGPGQVPFQQPSQVYPSRQPYSQSFIPESSFQPQNTNIPNSFNFGPPQQQQLFTQQQQQQQPQQTTSGPMYGLPTDDALEMLLTNLSSQPQTQQQQMQQQQQMLRQQMSQQQQMLQQQQMSQQQPSSQEWVGKQQSLQEEIEQQKKRLQYLLKQQESHQMLLPQQPSTYEQSSVHSGSVSSLTPTPSPSSSVGLGAYHASPVQQSFGTSPLPPQLTTGDQNGPNHANGDTTNLSFVSSVDFIVHSADNTSPSALELQELWQQLQ